MNSSTITGSSQNMASTSNVVTSSPEIMKESTLSASTKNIASTSKVVTSNTVFIRP
jgi:hypothetical protein